MLKQSLNRWWLFGSVALILLLAFFTREVLTAHSFVYSIDIWFENLLLSVRTPFLLIIFSWITFFGSTFVALILAGLVSVAILFFKINKSYLLGLAVMFIGAIASNYLIKIIIGRARPGGLIPSIAESSFSFPSGHSVMAMALYGFIALILCELYPKKTKMLVTIAIIVILVIGFSRLYLGVHFSSDVIAGYILGGLWLLTGIAIKNRFQSDNRFSNYSIR